MKTQFLLILPLLVFLQACSFSKDKKSDATPVVTLHAEEKKALSENQKDILAAIEIGDNKRLQSLIENARSADLVFEKVSNTPMAAALRANNKEAVQLLFKHSVDIFNLGKEQSVFNDDAFNVNVKALLQRLNHNKRAVAIVSALNDAGLLILQEYTKKVDAILQMILEGKSAQAKAALIGSKVSCSFFEEQALLSLQSERIIASQVVLDFLRNLPCKSEIPPKHVQEIYQNELIRQFQVLFSKPDLLSYLSAHEKLESRLWNIDNSGIWVSPSLLYRISWSEENRRQNDHFCELVGSPCKGQDIQLRTSNLFLENNKIAPAKFELIHVSSGKVQGSYRYFPRQVSGKSDSSRRDDFFFYASVYLNGKPFGSIMGSPRIDENGTEIPPEFVEAEIPWSLGLQDQRRGVILQSEDTPTDEEVVEMDKRDREEETRRNKKAMEEAGVSPHEENSEGEHEESFPGEEPGAPSGDSPLPPIIDDLPAF